jgi:hypothetical protein
VRPGKEPVVVSLSDRAGLLWAATVPGKRLARHGRLFTFTPRRASESGRQLRALRLALGRKHSVRVAAVSAPVDLTRGGTRALKPPFAVTLEVGDDAGLASVDCHPGPGGGRCR